MIDRNTLIETVAVFLFCGFLDIFEFLNNGSFFRRKNLPEEELTMIHRINTADRCDLK
jgi:hypothetical protein